MTTDLIKADPKTVKAVKRDVSEAIKQTYFNGLGEAIDRLSDVLKKHGLSTADMDGIYTGREGMANNRVAKNLWLTMSWYRLESGRYEVIAYV